MDRNNPVEVMLVRSIEEVQMFLLADAEENQAMTEVQLIKYDLIKLSKTGGLYAKAIEHWNARDPKDRRAWVDFKTHMIEEYEKLLRKSGGTTMGQEGYGMAYNATEETDDLSLAESIVKYAERATTAERSVADLEGRLAVLEMGNTIAPPPQAAYLANLYVSTTTSSGTNQHPTTAKLDTSSRRQTPLRRKCIQRQETKTVRSRRTWRQWVQQRHHHAHPPSVQQ
eukprot:scaffold108912_cov35-Attheya_sp.AAC.7